MTHAAVHSDDVTPFVSGRLRRRHSLLPILCGALALVSGVAATGVLIVAIPALPPIHIAASTLSIAVPRPITNASRPAAVETAAMPPAPVAPSPAAHDYAALLDPSALAGASPSSFGQNLPLGSTFAALVPTAALLPPAALVPTGSPDQTSASASTASLPPSADGVGEPEQTAVLTLPPSPTPPLVESQAQPMVAAADPVPLPVPRPSELSGHDRQAPYRTQPRQMASLQPHASAAPTSTPDNRSFLEKLFDAPAPSSGPALGYAASEDGLFGNPRRLAANPTMATDRGVAIYDISAHTVYMPDGSQLEAHSGLGDRLDNPRHVSERMRGPTPPQSYELRERESLFHGVRALRLNPVGGGGTFGRTGLLAHTYMLGPNGDSNGCVSFKNYNAFLQAYLSGQVRRLVVVARSS
ncbi:DUF2778 domain-containing protein [Lichenihabitans psoromatis]|uniref:DUF2778 domain-containing protein n=1 Tax=Lichenihabitans psoromatis TaxID=2528642 RepID=UPI001FE20335|nr:DUF2778 domain-containing protein [Lichenihabitans psoromatis]